MRNNINYAVLGGGLALIAGSALWLVLTGAADIRYSADHVDTVPMWHRWIPVLAGLALVRLVPPRKEPPGGVTGGRGVRVQAVVLLMAALVFAVALRWSGGGEPAHTVLKLALLAAVPAALFWWSRRDPVTLVREPLTAWRRYGPAAPVAAWLVLSYAGPLAPPTSDFAATVDTLTLVVTVVVVFVVNALLEEFFYRRWLQTRWEHLLGPWPAIVLSSLLWASWHIGIQGTGDLPRDLASAFVNQGVQGLFLGYLWSRYRLMWPLLVVHGAVNAAPILLGMV
ncbi:MULTISPECIES: CPBP family intramembrane glutamic endopeptidase [unclassified Nonomuraea]|uniref:CPBP family intramembrane glutamic endopeptidase n=1 Tax=unclassified Nonomuraea TaxID=2593643 RepID=UPI00207BADEF|nr:type II CAAX endopeptidase family protein [Nonomuraea sp. KC401]